jgi:iron complex outermembrane receptor protein
VTLRYQPTGDVMLRASWRQSIRPPAFEELFTPVRQIFSGIGNPGGIPPLAQATWISGNPELSPETTDAYSAGIVWNPQFFSSFSMTLDVYQMFTTNLVLDPDSVTQTLLAQNTIDPDGCGLGLLPGSGPAKGITRNRDNGAMDCVDSGFGNGGKRLVQGLVVTALYEFPTEHFGKLTICGSWNHFFSWKGQPGSGSPTTSFLGNYDNRTLPFAPGAIPWNKGFLRGEWEWNGFDLVGTGNYIGDFRDDLRFDTIARAERRNVPSYITLDLQLSYEWKKPVPDYTDDAKNPPRDASSSTIWRRLLWGTRLTVGVNNAFDRNPPTVLAVLNDNYDTSLYSLRNRYCYIAVTKKF